MRNYADIILDVLGIDSNNDMVKMAACCCFIEFLKEEDSIAEAIEKVNNGRIKPYETNEPDMKMYICTSVARQLLLDYIEEGSLAFKVAYSIARKDVDELNRIILEEINYDMKQGAYGWYLKSLRKMIETGEFIEDIITESMKLKEKIGLTSDEEIMMEKAHGYYDRRGKYC